MLHAILNRIKCEAEQRAEEGASRSKKVQVRMERLGGAT
jgi:hypothetical protein